MADASTLSGETRPEELVVDAMSALGTPKAHGASCSVGV